MCSPIRADMDVTTQHTAPVALGIITCCHGGATSSYCSVARSLSCCTCKMHCAQCSACGSMLLPRVAHHRARSTGAWAARWASDNTRGEVVVSRLTPSLNRCVSQAVSPLLHALLSARLCRRTATAPRTAARLASCQHAWCLARTAARCSSSRARRWAPVLAGKRRRRRQPLRASVWSAEGQASLLVRCSRAHTSPSPPPH
jgi:hypothetical protein